MPSMKTAAPPFARIPRMQKISRTILLWSILCMCAMLPASARDTASAALRARDQQLLENTLAKLAPQRPGVPDLYVVGFAGDSEEDVFRNEVMYLETLMTKRFAAQDRIITLINHRDSTMKTPRPLASLDNLRTTLANVAKRMDPEQDILLLFMTMHGTREHQLFVQMVPGFFDLIDPQELRKLLDDAGIRNRVLVISACYSGGFVRALHNDDTMILTAARKNRPSFGCGSDSNATYFGRAWLIEALNQTTDFVEAFDKARTRIAAREKAENFEPSFPQIDIGSNIQARLQAWQAQLTPGPAQPYPYDVKSDAAPAPASPVKPSIKPRKKPSARGATTSRTHRHGRHR